MYNILCIRQYQPNNGRLLVIICSFASMDTKIKIPRTLISRRASLSCKATMKSLTGSGGRFNTHPQQEVITFLMKEHELTKNCREFELMEEPYQFELEDDRKEVFLMYIYRGKEYPAGWRKTFGEGKVVYLMPGHTADKFTCEEYIRLIRNGMDWLGTNENFPQICRKLSQFLL